MNNAYKLGKIAKEQFAIKNCAAPEQIISKRAVLDHSQYKRNVLLLASADLEACYDRVIHTAAALALLRVGISHAKNKTMFKTIQLMTHRIRTLFGDSDITWGGQDIEDLEDWENYPQGVLQGNAAGPAIWSLISSIIFEILHKRGFAVKFCTSISKEIFCLVGFAYVDDSDLIQQGSDPATVLSSMQALINSWGQLIDVTGGAISVSKSWWYMIEYVWKRGKWVATDAGNDLDLVATSATGEAISLKRLHANQSSKMLGIYISPDGNKEALITDLKTEAIKWGTKLRTGNSTRFEAWTALHTNISAKLKYPLPACTLNEEECKSIMWPTLKAALPKSGISYMISTEYRDGPRDYGGAGCLSLFHCQGSTRTALFIELTHRQTPAGFFLLLCLEDMVLDAGLYGSIWLMEFEKVSKYLQTHSLLYHMWEYNVNHKIDISVSHKELQPNRDGDIPLMTLAQQLYSTTSELRSIQRVRMKLGVIHLSDVTSADGKKMNPDFYSIPPSKIHRNNYDWPIKHHITKEDKALWRRFLKKIFCGGNDVLPQQLGAWIDMPTANWIDTWDYFQSPCTEFLYHRTPNHHWHRHIKQQRPPRAYLTRHQEVTYHIQYLDLGETPPDAPHRVTVKKRDTSLIITSTSAKIVDIPTTNPIHLSFGNINIIKPQIDWFANFITSSTTTERLWHEILAGTSYAVSDGSYFPSSRTGACAWILATRDGGEWIKGGGVVPGDKEDQDPYRSELGGQVGLASFISAIILPPGSTPEITIACDGLAAINRVNMDRSILKAKMTNIDMLSVISELWDGSNFSLIKQHVYGHQDDLGRPLTQLETLNCIVDEYAKDIARQQMNGTLPPLHFSTTSLGFGSVKCHGHLITSNLQGSLYKQVTKYNYLTSLGQHSEFPLNFAKVNVHWESFSTARKEASFSTNIFLTKWLSGDTATGRVMVQRKARLGSQCPMCNHNDEHLLHVLTCSSSSATELRNNLLSELMVWLESVQTAPAIENFIHLGLTAWFENPGKVWGNDDAIFSHDNNIDEALRSQLHLGWYYFLCGMQTDKFVNIQQEYYEKINSRRLGTRWATNVTQKMWNILHQIWKHRCNILHNTDALHNNSG